MLSCQKHKTSSRWREGVSNSSSNDDEDDDDNTNSNGSSSSAADDSSSSSSSSSYTIHNVNNIDISDTHYNHNYPISSNNSTIAATT